MRFPRKMLFLPLLLLGVLPAAAENPPPYSAFGAKGRQFQAALTKAFATHRAAPVAAVAPDPVSRQTANIAARTLQKTLNATVVIKDNFLGGSGFIAELWGIPVIVTNAHVLVEAVSPEISDIMQNVYRPYAALVSKERDIALLAIELPPGVNPLRLSENVAALNESTELFAFGNSLGGDVVTNKRGRLAGIGSALLQITCPVVPGDSGGPVVTRADEVVGMSTFLTVVDDFTATLNRRKESAKLVRRFALRLDNLTPREFEIFDTALQTEEIKEFRRIKKLNRRFLTDLPKQNTYDGGQRLFFREYSTYDFDWQGRSSLQYLDKLLREARGESCRIAAAANMPLLHISDAQRTAANGAFRKLERYCQKSFVCRVCAGSGTLAEYKLQNSRQVSSPGSEESRSSRGTSGRTRQDSSIEFSNDDDRQNACRYCRGAGRKNVPYYEAKHDYFDIGTLRQQRFLNGFPPFGVSPKVAEKMLNKPHLSARGRINGIFGYSSFAGNPVFSAATETRLGYLANKLFAVSVRFDRSSGSWDDLRRELTSLFGKAVATAGDYENYGYILWQKKEFTAALITAKNFAGGGIRLVIQHNTLSALSFLVRDKIAGRYFISPEIGTLPAVRRDTLDVYL